MTSVQHRITPARNIPMSPILASACLLGRDCRYDARPLVAHPKVLRLMRQGRAVPYCAEVSGGLPVPREPAKIVGGDGDAVLDGNAKVLTASGRDVTEAFVRGARAALAAAQAAGARQAWLKTGSPSCDPAYGVTACLLKRAGIKVLPLHSPRQA